MKQWKSEGNVDVKKKPGRPPSVNTRRNRAIIKKRITRNDAVSVNSMAKSLNTFRQSVQNIVRKISGASQLSAVPGAAFDRGCHAEQTGSMQEVG